MNKYNNIKKFFPDNEIVDNISQYVENDVENIENIDNDKKNKNNIIDDEKKKEERKNNDDEKINRFVDNSNYINNQIFNDVVKL